MALISPAARPNPVARAAHQGYTLVEVLVAVVILSVGLLGLAGLQARGMRGTHDAYLRSQAAMLAYDIADRMRANRQVALTGGYVIALAGSAPTGASVAERDLNQWLTALTNSLPAGDGSITANGSSMTINVHWGGNTTADCSSTFLAPCLQVEVTL